MSRSVLFSASVGQLGLAMAVALIASCSGDDPAAGVGPIGGSAGAGGTGGNGGSAGSQSPMGASGSNGTIGGMAAAGTTSAGSGGSAGTGGGGGSGGGGTGNAQAGTAGTGGTPQPSPKCPTPPPLDYQGFDGMEYEWANWWGTGTPTVTPDGYVDEGGEGGAGGAGGDGASSCYTSSTTTEEFVQIGTTFAGYNSCATFADITAVSFYAKATVAGPLTVQLDLPETTPVDQKAYLPLAACDQASCEWKGLKTSIEITTEWAHYTIPIADFKGNFPMNDEQAVLRMFWEITGTEGEPFGLSIDEVTFE